MTGKRGTDSHARAAKQSAHKANDWKPPKAHRYAGFPPTMWFVLAAHHAQTRYVSGHELAFAIAQNPDSALPEPFRNYLCRFLRGAVTVPKSTSRKEANNVAFNALARQCIENDYQEARRRFKDGRKAKNSRGSRGDASAHLQAAKLMQEKYRDLFEAMTPERVANILSSWRPALRRRASRY
jgi:hypothetical protein